MKLTLQDRIALIYTSAGSLRRTASLIGISHQKVGRILRAGQPGELSLTSKVLTDPGLVSAVNQAFSIHKEVARQQARVDGLPFVPQVPIFYRRMLFASGVPGDRVEAMHLHYLPDRLKWTWLANIHPTGKFYAASVGSIVGLAAYNRLADAVRRGAFRDEETLYHKQTILREIGMGVVNTRIQTRYTPFEPRFDIEWVLSDIIGKLKEKHEPATGDPGTALADRILLQVDTRNDRDKRFRAAHPIPAKPRKARRNTKRRRKPST